MDISKTTEPRSDQQNFDDYVNGPKTVTISEVKKGSAEQPVELHLVEYPGRPYKPGKTLTESLHILGKMRLDGHIDPDLFDIFIRARVYERYAKDYLDPAQVDVVDVKKIPGYSGD